MGWRFRKSISFFGGAFRINISKSGIGYSYGGPGARVTHMANGRTRYTTSIPGTGISHVTETSSKKKQKTSSYQDNRQTYDIKQGTKVNPVEGFGMLVEKANNSKHKKWAWIFFGVIATMYILTVTSANAHNKQNNNISESINYNGQEIDLYNLTAYPFGADLERVLAEIGVDDALSAVCEVDNMSLTTLRITTESKRLWVSIKGAYYDVRYVEWIKDYDTDCYYYISPKELGYNEQISSYKAEEILIEPVEGDSVDYPLVLSVEQFVGEVLQDLEAAKKKYEGKYIQITGTVQQYYFGKMAYHYYLYGKQEDDKFKIICSMRTNKKVAVFGTTITFLGYITEMLTDDTIKIEECKVITE